MAYKNKEDEKAYQHEHYLLHKEKYIAKAKASNIKYKKRNREFVNEYKMKYGCSKCNYRGHPSALDFHHVDGSDKENNIAIMINESYSLERIKKEIKKCIILCANCHRIEHYSGEDV